MTHTVELSKQIDNDTFNQILSAYSFHSVKLNKRQTNFICTDFSNQGINKITLCRYDKAGDQESVKQHHTYYSILIILNLAKLVGQNYSRISLYQVQKCDDFSKISDKFREAMSEITSGDIELQELCDINSYITRRIDFCCQFKVEDPQLYIYLLNRGRFPSHGKYCNMGYENSCYIVGGKVEDGKIIRHGSITINIYDKQAEMKAPKNYGKGYTAEDFSEAENVLRVEVQAFRRKMIDLKDKYRYPDRCLKHYLDVDLAKELLLCYVKEVAGTADYYTHRALKSKVNGLQPKKVHQSTKDKILDILDDLNGNAKQRPTLQEYIKQKPEKERRNLKDTLKTMDDKGINPIAIPNMIDGRDVQIHQPLQSVYSLIEGYFANANKDSIVPTDDRLDELDEEYLLEEAMTDDEIEEDFNQQE